MQKRVLTVSAILAFGVSLAGQSANKSAISNQQFRGCPTVIPTCRAPTTSGR
jgi:hypothetical protein